VDSAGRAHGLRAWQIILEDVQAQDSEKAERNREAFQKILPPSRSTSLVLP
jgi:hypothetical protein